MQANDTFWFSPKGVAALAIIACPTYFLLMEHREHVFQALPYLILLLCPLMHLFMHGGHGGHGDGNEGHHHNDEHGQDEKSYRQGYEEGLKAASKQEHHH